MDFQLEDYLNCFRTKSRKMKGQFDIEHFDYDGDFQIMLPVEINHDPKKNHFHAKIRFMCKDRVNGENKVSVFTDFLFLKK